jgi:hypothetical protein
MVTKYPQEKPRRNLITSLAPLVIAGLILYAIPAGASHAPKGQAKTKTTVAANALKKRVPKLDI